MIGYDCVPPTVQSLSSSTEPGRDPVDGRLQREARRYEALISAEGVIVWVIDPELRPTGRNHGWEQYTGQSPEEYARLGWLDAVHPDDRAVIRRGAEHAIQNGLPVALEVRLRRADGEYRRNFIRALPIREDGRIVEWIGTASDVEDVRTAADAQKDLRARLFALTEGAEPVLSTRDQAAARAGVLALAQRVLPADGHAIWWLDVKTHQWQIVHGSGLSESFVSQGVEGEFLPFHDPIAVPDVATWGLVNHRRDAYAREGIRSLLTIPLPIGGENRATIVVYYRSLHDATDTELRVGVALGQMAAAALWNAETYEALQRSRMIAEAHAERMAFLADASALLGSLEYETTLREVAHLAVPRIADWCSVDIRQPDGSMERLVTVHVDPAKVDLARIFEERYPVDPGAPRGLPNVMRTGQLEFYPQITDEMLATAARDEEHLRILLDLGVRSVALVPLTARSQTLGAIVFVRSSADRPFSEDDVTVLSEVARRAALAIDNARLYRDAERANQAKDDFLAILSHELRTPLNAMMGWIHMLRDGLPEEMSRHALDVIGRNARTQKQLVEDLLDVARIAGGRLDLQCARLDLREVARVAVDSALPAARNREIALSFESAGAEVAVSGDAIRLQQVMANLLSNALKFTEPGGCVTVRVAAAGTVGEVSVTDTGIGMSPEFLPKAFDRFRQADTSLTRAYGGLGLGLWVVKQVVDAHGGHVRAQSPGHGQGTTVTFTLPLA